MIRSLPGAPIRANRAARHAGGTPRACLAIALGLLAPLLGAAAPADAPEPQLAGLFMQSCLAYAGLPAGLREWAQRTGLHELPDPARAAFLHGAPGTVFDASNADGKFVVASSQGGVCSVITNQAAGPAVINALEADLAAADVKYRLVIERDDKLVPDLHSREYLATRKGRSWRIQAATMKHAAPGQAMLTAAPE